ncbi:MULTISPECIES: hypothetical protein [unclassified Streptomyces]|uniref:hypothetical protein n=1 Tax=unclassified Streptomyces TaxID=2593676 RepID=UPI000CD59DE5|nr:MULTISPECIES: hypothetical protein [unclassified Streptomyces]
MGVISRFLRRGRTGTDDGSAAASPDSETATPRADATTEGTEADPPAPEVAQRPDRRVVAPGEVPETTDGGSSHGDASEPAPAPAPGTATDTGTTADGPRTTGTDSPDATTADRAPASETGREGGTEADADTEAEGAEQTAVATDPAAIPRQTDADAAADSESGESIRP